jgi:tetratricopeptide (TPR) repeat protein
LGYSYLILSRNEEAIAAFRKSLQINPSEASAYINIATCYTSMSNYAEAIPNYLKAIEIHPNFLTEISINHEFGFTYVDAGEIPKAEETFRKMLSMPEASKQAQGHRSLALLNMYQGRYSAAIEHLRDAIVLNKTANRILSEYRDRCYLTAAYKVKGMIDEFKAEITAVRQLTVDTQFSPGWLSIAAKMYARNGMTEEASQFLEEISARISDHTAESGFGRSGQGDRAAYNLIKGEIEIANKNYDDVVDLFLLANKLDDRSELALESLAHGYVAQGNSDKAIDTYQELIGKRQLGGEYQEYWILAHYQLGKTYEHKGEIEKAIEFYEKFLDIWRDADPDLPALVDAQGRLAKLKSDRR